MTTLLTIAGCQAPAYDPHHASIGDVFTIAIYQLHPTQAVVGQREVERKTRKISDMDAEKLQRYIEKKTVPTVIGPDNELYMIDHHHTMTGFLESGRSDVCLTRIVAHLFDACESEFWHEMEQRHWVYLKNAQGQAILPSQLPAHLGHMENDPYRSLAGEVRDLDGFQKTDTPFAEFQWANFFRSRVPLGTSESDWKNAVRQATPLAHSPAAKALPGYIAD